MNTKINDGGPAFPQTRSTLSDGSTAYIKDSCATITSSGGMTLRDYFAAKAMVGMLSNNDIDARNLVENSVTQSHLAQFVYAMADAMLAARKASK